MSKGAVSILTSGLPVVGTGWNEACAVNTVLQENAQHCVWRVDRLFGGLRVNSVSSIRLVGGTRVMQSSISSFFKKTTPEKPKSESTTAAENKSASPQKITPKSTPEKASTTPEKVKLSPKTPISSNKKSITPEVSPTQDKSSRKRKSVEEHEEGGEEVEPSSPKRSKEDQVVNKRSFSSDTLLDDDDTLASVDLSTVVSTPVKKSVSIGKDLEEDDSLYNMELPSSGSAKATTTKPTITTTTTTTTSTPTKSSATTAPPKFGAISTTKGTFSNMPEKQAELATRLTGFLTDESWKAVLQPEFKKPYFTSLIRFLEGEHAIKNNKIFPPENLIFNALNRASFDKVSVVILGQDPYIKYNQAMGMSFSVPRGVAPPPSLKNVYKELASDIEGFQVPNHGDLTKWADQGVLLLNAVLTVRASESNSHKGKGWESLTKAVIDAINTKKEGVVFLLWGKDAQNNAGNINTKKHLVLRAVHPSPLAGDKFLGNKHFSKANKWLAEKGLPPIDWTL